VNWTVNGAVPDVGVPVKLATGAGAGAEADTLMNMTWLETLNPLLLVAFSLIEKFPAPNIDNGLLPVLNVNGVLLPETFVAFHIQPVGVLVDESVNWTVNGAMPDVGIPVKLATGAGAGAGADTLMNVVWLETLNPLLLVAFSLIEKFPAPNIDNGLGPALNVNGVLLPDTFVAFHIQPVGVLVDESVNWTVNGAMPDVGVPVKLATGAGAGAGADTLMNVTWLETLNPLLLVAFSLIEKFPAPNVDDGLWLVLNVNGVLLPDTFVAFHIQPVGVLVDESVNWTVNGAMPDNGVPVKLATGGADAVVNVPF